MQLAETNAIVVRIAQRIERHHELLLKVTEDLTDEQFAHPPGLQAPPIGWHLWHITRWADRIQSKFNSNATELWNQENLAQIWGLMPEKLGRLETGIEMAVVDAVILSRVGKDPHLNYTRRVFATLDNTLANLKNDTQLLEQSISLFDEQEMTLIDSLLFHLSHTGRHLGMIEALRGALFHMSGSATN